MKSTKSCETVKHWNWLLLGSFNDFSPDSFPSNSLSYEKKNTPVCKNVLIFFFFLKYNRKFAHIGLHLNIAEHKNTSIESIHLQFYTEVVSLLRESMEKKKKTQKSWRLAFLAKTGMTLSNFISGAHTIFRIGMSLLSITGTLVTWKSLGTKQGRYFGRKFPRMAHLKICVFFCLHLQRLHH